MPSYRKIDPLWCVRRLKDGRRGRTLLVTCAGQDTYVACNKTFLAWRNHGRFGKWRPTRPPTMDRLLRPAEDFRRRLENYADEMREAIRSAKVLDEVFKDRSVRGFVSPGECLSDARLVRKYLRAKGVCDPARQNRFVERRMLTPDGKLLAESLRKSRSGNLDRPGSGMADVAATRLPSISEASKAFSHAMELRRKLVDVVEWLEPLDQDGLRWVRQFHERRWAAFSMWLRVPEGRRLFTEFPQLAWMMSNSALFKRKPVKQPLRSIRSLVLKPRRQILKWLDLPPTRGTLTLLRRIRPDALTGKTAYRLKTVLNHPRKRERLHDLADHFQGRPLSMRALSIMAFNQPVSQPLLKALLDAPDTLYTLNRRIGLLDIWRIYKDTMQLFNRDLEGDLDWRARIERIESLRGLRDMHDELVDHLNGNFWSSSMQIEWTDEEIPPPLNHPDWLVPLSRREDLVRESQEMRNCVATFAGRIYAGTNYAFGVHRPDVRATLLLQKNAFNVWTISQLERARNRPAPDALWHEIEAWLRDPKTCDGINTDPTPPTFYEPDEFIPF